MGKASKKKQQSGNKMSKKELQKKLRGILSEANDTQHNPWDSLPPSFLTVPPSPQSSSCNGVDDMNIKNDGTATINNNKDDTSCTKDETNNNVIATIQHYASSQLPLPMLNQCLELFKLNMSDMYANSNWGLNMNAKKEELMHKDARFLVVLSSKRMDGDEPSAVVDADATISKEDTESDTDGTIDNTLEAEVNSNNKDNQDINNYKVLGFAHFRYELDDNDTPPQHTITYLYELQISPSTQGHGLGKKLMTIIELLSIKNQMKKVMLTVFHVNKNAMGFYTKNKYVVDECSPSNFEGNEDCDYEILSKCLGK